MKIKPLKVLIAYIVTIFIYSFIYWLNTDHLNLNDITFFQSLYFSIVTITTLGYGDILPTSDFGMFLTATEVIIGIIIIGLLLNSIWQFIEDRLEKTQERSLKKSISEKNLSELLSYYEYFETVIHDFFLIVSELTTPIERRRGDLIVDSEFKFSDMKDMYKQSLYYKNGIGRPLIHIYYERLDTLAEDLKFFLSNIDLTEHPLIKNLIIDFLKNYRSNDMRNVLFSYEKAGTNQHLLKDSLSDLIRETHECPEVDSNSDIITPAIHLYHAVTFQIEELFKLEKYVEKLKKDK